ncbi:MAG TPA: hypothetical protein V6D20_05255 [Candidatus Obscuribacterales bacterium]
MAHTPATHVHVCLRLMYWVQVQVFDYIQERSLSRPGYLPNFASMERALGIKTYENDLPHLPQTWLTVVDEQQPAPRLGTGPGTARGGKSTGTAPAAAAGTAKPSVISNPNLDASLNEQYTGSGHTSVNSLLKAHSGNDPLVVPKIGGHPVCLSYLLRGTCYEGCKRASTHIQANKNVIDATHKLLTDCGVATKP